MIKISLVCGLLTACASKPNVVNGDPALPILPMLPTGSFQTAQDSIGRAPTAAIEGKVVSSGEIPTPLSNVQLGLYHHEKSGWREITKLSSAPDGSFRITQKLLVGSYEIRVIDSRFHGVLPIQLDAKPVKDVILSASKK